MKTKRWIPLAIFLVAALLSAWLSPALGVGTGSAATSPPESALPGGMNGRTLLRSGEALDVKVGVASSAHDVVWKLDGRPVGKASDLYLQRLRNGEHLLSLTYRDSRDRLFATTALVRVLEPGAYAIQAAAVQAAIALPLWEEDPQIYLPLIQH